MAAEMLTVLSSLSNNDIMVYEDLSDINFDQIFYGRTTLIFAQYDIISSIKSRNSSQQLVQYFIFDDHPCKTQQSQTVVDSTDLMFELADEFEGLCRNESNEDVKMGNIDLGQRKKT